MDVYKRRPISDNSGGMKSPHLLALYVWLRNMKPTCIIESGIFKGLGTWVIRQACPTSEIISFDINLNSIIYRDSDATYLNFDLNSYPFQELSAHDSEKVCVVLDDHQDFHTRIQFFKNHNIKNVIYEDNYPMGQGDCISPKKIIERTRGSNPDHTYILDINQSSYIKNFISSYEEFPPAFIDPLTRWGVPWDYETRPPLLDDKMKTFYPILYEERFNYTWICRMEIS